MPGPLHWFRNPKNLADEDLILRTCDVLLQLNNERWLGDADERQRLEAMCIAHLSVIEERIAQGRLFED